MATYSPYIFVLLLIINIRHISNHKTTSVGLEPQWYITQPVVFTAIDHLLVLESLTRLIHFIFFALDCIISIGRISCHKMTSLPLDHFLVVASISRLIHLLFLIFVTFRIAKLVRLVLYWRCIFQIISAFYPIQ
jgi:hypothetical protein